MKKVLILALLCITITGCGKKIENKPREKYEGDTAENITMTIKDGTLTNRSATVIIKDLTGKDNIYGEEYGLCEKINNECFSLPTKVSPVTWTLREYHVDDNNLLEIDIDWEWLYGSLKPGEYKLIKGIYVYEENKSYSFSANFTIE